MGFVNRAYVDATITANNAHASMLVPFVNYKAHSWLSGTKGKLTNSVAKGILDVKNTKYVGGIVAKTWPYGAVQNNVTYAKVIKGEELFGSNDVNDGDANPFVSNLFGVIGYSSSEDGTGRDNKNKNKLKHLSKAEADEKVASFNITDVYKRQIISLILGIISIKLTAKGFVVCSLHFFICSRSSSGLIPPEANIPNPPALETALASS